MKVNSTYDTIVLEDAINTSGQLARKSRVGASSEIAKQNGV